MLEKKTSQGGFILLIVLVVVVIGAIILGAGLQSVGIEKQINTNRLSMVRLLNETDKCLDNAQVDRPCSFSGISSSEMLDFSDNWWAAKACHLNSLDADFTADYIIEPLGADDCAVLGLARGVYFYRITCHVTHLDPFRPSVIVQAVIVKEHFGSSCAGKTHALDSAWQGWRILKL